MQTDTTQPGVVRRTVNDLVMAEMFLVQATIESATVIGDGLQTLGREFTQRDAPGHGSWESLSHTLQRIAGEALEPYSTRFRYLRDMITSQH